MSTGKAAKLLGVSVKTLQRWEREGRLTAVARTDSNRRLYTEAQIREFIGLRQSVNTPIRLVAYCRVSSAAQEPDLANQRKVLEEFVVAKGLANVEFVEEVGGGLNFKRKRFLALMEDIGRREVKTLILAHRDRADPVRLRVVRALCQNQSLRTASAQSRTSFSRAGNGAGLDDHRALLFVPVIRSEELPKKAGRGIEEGREQ